MSTDINTELTIRGTEEEMLAMINVLKHFENDCYEQYKANHDCAYIEFVTFKQEGKWLKYFKREFAKFCKNAKR